MHTIGTAGHVDHGKSALVIALTGHDPDRLIEEQRRGMTLDLGFAPLRFDDGVGAGIIDVPGHERFLHNMLAGAAGMELLLLVIAATEGPRAQTLEHLQVLGFLNVRKTLIVLTKSDLVDATAREEVLARTRAACAGSVADGAPAYFVSNVTGEGIAELRAAIHAALAALPPRAPDAPAYLPIDRVFSLAGHGTIVTGTLMQGTISTGDALKLQPSGIDARVRGLHVFGKAVPKVQGGSRVAVNIAGVDAADLARGETLTASREFTPTRDIELTFTPLASALPLLRRRTPVRAHIGSAEIPGWLVFDGRPPSDIQGVRARLILHTPVAVCRGSRLVLRRLSPKDLLGGAVAEPALSANGARLESQAAPAPLAAEILNLLEGADLTPHAASAIAASLNVRASDADDALRALVERGQVVVLKQPSEYLSASTAAAALARVNAFLRTRHAHVPWSAGATSAEIADDLGSAERLVARLLALWLAAGSLARSGKYWHALDHQPSLTHDQRSAIDGMLRSADPNPLVPIAFDAFRAATAKSKVPGLADAVDGLFARDDLVRIGDDVYRRSQLEEAQAILVRLLRSTTGGATLSLVRDAFGTSRRYALPLLEYFDGLGITMRDGDLRRLRGPQPTAQT
ncbi:MAG TPA: selenocysteine-specific translation elongation factor [Candidatus Eremiobacteraceae bacterium]|nr:selenocysteine-specific translation elongation factor [Candidatus Eremiobacteraceae bacterium]